MQRGKAKSTRRLVSKKRVKPKVRKSPFVWVKVRMVGGSATDTMAVRLNVGSGTFASQLTKAKAAFTAEHFSFFAECDQQKFYKGQPDAVRYYDETGANMKLDNWRAKSAASKRGLYASS